VLNSRGFSCKVTKATNAETKRTSQSLWLCVIQTPFRFKGYYGYKDKKTGEWKPYINSWVNVHIWTDEIIDIGDQLFVEEFTLVQKQHKRNEFDVGKWVTKIHVFAFTNLTKGYRVMQADRRKRSKRLAERVSQATLESLSCRYEMAEIERQKADAMDEAKQKRRQIAREKSKENKILRLARQAENERLEQIRLEEEKQRLLAEENERKKAEAEREAKIKENDGIAAFEVK